MDDLDHLRKEIDQIDEQIIILINKRAQTSKKIGEIKQQQNISVLQPDRELNVINHVQSLATDITPNNVAIIWKEIMSACRQVQGKNFRVAYFGPEGTFTHQAALEFFPQSNTQFIPHDKTYEIFQQVEGNYVDFGIVPVENSLNGSVPETLDLLIEKNVQIYGEIELRVVHNLIGQPGTKFSQLKTIYSHPNALGQISEWVKKNIPQVEMIEMSSTAKAVQKVAELKDPSVAAIGMELAAKLYNLSILARGIEDNSQNFTRFLILSKQKPAPTNKDKTSMVFVVKHVPGALFNIIKYFADANINLAKIESRPRKSGKDTDWEYIFILDFDENSERVKSVLDKVRNDSIWVKILGSYPRNPRKAQ